MKILVLSYPYHGAYEFCDQLATAISYKYINDPMDLNWHGAIRHDGEHDPNTGEVTRVEVTIPRPYIYPNAIPDNSITLHYVKSHKLPKNFTESEFLADWVSNFDKVIVLRNQNLELNWKRWCAWKSQDHEDNIAWKRHLQYTCDYIEYKDSYFDQTCVDKINEADLFLESYANDNSLLTTFMGTIQRQSAANNNKEIDEINEELAKWGIGDTLISYTSANDTWVNYDLYANLNAWGNSY